MLKCVSLIVACALPLLAGAGSSQAQVPCTDRAALVKYLAEKYGEAQTGYGISNHTSVVEIFVSKNGSFTILSTQPKGVSCIIATGQNWEGNEAPRKMTAL